MPLPDIIGGILESFMSWRFYVCLVISLLITGLILLIFGDTSFAVWASMPVVIIGFVSGLIWEIKSETK